MKLTWYGTASLVLAGGGRRVAIDPYLRFPRRNEALRAPFRAVDAVLITHGHFDHIADIADLYADADVPIYGTRTPAASLLRDGVPEASLRVVAPGDTVDFGGMRARLYQGRHCAFDLPIILGTVLRPAFFGHLGDVLRLQRLRRDYPENGEILFYEFSEGDKRLQVMGSLNLDADTAYPTGADALVMAFQGRSDIDRYALPFVERLRPKRVLLDHYDDAFPPMSADVDTRAFVRAVRERYGIPCAAMVRGEAVEI